MNIELGFWKKVKAQAVAAGRPIFVMAPLADVTDAAFRQIIARYSKMGTPTGGPDVMWTEFVSADGLCSAGRDILLRDLVYSPAERPIVAQLFTSHPEKMYEAAKLVASLGFDGLDINMGCPDKSIEKQCAGAAMMKDPELAKKVIRAAMDGVADGSRTAIPVSVKTRIGYNKVEIETWVPELLSTGIAALTIHARTRKEMSDVPARWEFVKRTVEIRDAIQSDMPVSERTLILGNGDVKDLADGRQKSLETGADGVMFGRAIFGNPWLFDESRASVSGSISLEHVSIEERLRVLAEHTTLFEKLLGDIKSFAIMKKHFKAYVAGWEGAKEFRMELMEMNSAEEISQAIDTYISTHLHKK